MPLISQPFRALIIGASGAIGSALTYELKHTPDCLDVVGIHRKSTPRIDYDHPESIKLAAEHLALLKPFDLIVNTIGVLHSENCFPEKRLADLEDVQLLQQFISNAIGPALTIKSFAKLVNPEGAVYATLSARVGSISDNRLGGWYSYRASKAALNMLVKTAAIELQRTRPKLALVAIHPGTVKSKLSRPFRGDEIGRDPHQAAREIISVLLNLEASDTGVFKSYAGEVLPW